MKITMQQLEKKYDVVFLNSCECLLSHEYLQTSTYLDIENVVILALPDQKYKVIKNRFDAQREFDNLQQVEKYLQVLYDSKKLAVLHKLEKIV